MKISAATQPPAPSREFTVAQEIAAHMSGAIRRAQAIAAPWPHWRIRNVLPPGLLRGLAQLPLQASIAVQPSGRRAYRNDKRIYFDYANMARFPPMRRIAETMQSPALASTVAETFGAALEHTFLRIEYALDADGFWLEPHTDIGEKKFTCFIYLDGADDLGTDIYADAQTLAYRVPFAANSALAFVPSHDTWHGFAPRPIERVRRSLIVNYVSADWRARAQLSFPDMPVRVAN